MSVIPIIASIRDLEPAIRHGNRNPGSRWYIARRASSLGFGDLVPSEWARVAPPMPDDGLTAAFGGDWAPPARDKAEKDGGAMDGGSFPIKDKADLKRAVAAHGRAKNKAAAKKHIIRHARKLGAISELPAAWGVTAGGAIRLPTRQGDGKVSPMTAAGWADDLHPRDRDGRFIEKLDLIDVFSKLNPDQMIARGQAVGSYKGADGKDHIQVKRDAEHGGGVIDVTTDAIQSAPNAKARLQTGDSPAPATVPATPLTKKPAELTTTVAFDDSADDLKQYNSEVQAHLSGEGLTSEEIANIPTDAIGGAYEDQQNPREAAADIAATYGPSGPGHGPGSDAVDAGDLYSYAREEGLEVDQEDVQAIIDAHPDWSGDQVYAEVEKFAGGSPVDAPADAAPDAPADYESWSNDLAQELGGHGLSMSDVDPADAEDMFNQGASPAEVAQAYADEMNTVDPHDATLNAEEPDKFRAGSDPAGQIADEFDGSPGTRAIAQQVLDANPGISHDDAADKVGQALTDQDKSDTDYGNWSTQLYDELDQRGLDPSMFDPNDTRDAFQSGKSPSDYADELQSYTDEGNGTPGATTDGGRNAGADAATANAFAARKADDDAKVSMFAESAAKAGLSGAKADETGDPQDHYQAAIDHAGASTAATFAGHSDAQEFHSKEAARHLRGSRRTGSPLERALADKPQTLGGDQPALPPSPGLPAPAAPAELIPADMGPDGDSPRARNPFGGPQPEKGTPEWDAKNTLGVALMRGADKDSHDYTAEQTSADMEKIFNSPTSEEAHKRLAALMTRLKMGGKQRARYKSLLDSYRGDAAAEPITPAQADPVVAPAGLPDASGIREVAPGTPTSELKAGDRLPGGKTVSKIDDDPNSGDLRIRYADGSIEFADPRGTVIAKHTAPPHTPTPEDSRSQEQAPSAPAPTPARVLKPTGRPVSTPAGPVDVGDLITYNDRDGTTSHMLVDEVSDDIKNGQPGFGGELVNSDGSPLPGQFNGKWGYADQADSVVRKGSDPDAPAATPAGTPAPSASAAPAATPASDASAMLDAANQLYNERTGHRSGALPKGVKKTKTDPVNLAAHSDRFRSTAKSASEISYNGKVVGTIQPGKVGSRVMNGSYSVGWAADSSGWLAFDAKGNEVRGTGLTNGSASEAIANLLRREAAVNADPSTLSDDDLRDALRSVQSTPGLTARAKAIRDEIMRRKEGGSGPAPTGLETLTDAALKNHAVMSTGSQERLAREEMRRRANGTNMTPGEANRIRGKA